MNLPSKGFKRREIIFVRIYYQKVFRENFLHLYPDLRIRKAITLLFNF